MTQQNQNGSPPMSSRLVTSSPQESTLVSLQAYKSLVSDYALRARQAEELVGQMLVTHLPKEVYGDSIVNKIAEHIEARELERSTQYLGVLQTTLLALTNLQRSISTTPIEQLDQELLTIIKALTVTVNPS